METLVDYCKDFIKDNIRDFEGQTHYACDFSFTITEKANSDGTLTYSRNKAKEYLSEWWDDCADYVEYEKLHFGELTHNPFENPEAFMVCMVVEGCNAILSECPIIEDNWNNKIELTEEVIDSILDYVDNFDEDTLF